MCGFCVVVEPLSVLKAGKFGQQGGLAPPRPAGDKKHLAVARQNPML